MAAQRILDPNSAEPVGPWVPTGPIPHATRKFGLFPDLTAIWPGDLVLVSALNPNFLARKITYYQKRGGYEDLDARWHHAAIYLPDGYLCEATGQGVITGRIYKYISGAHLLRFRRDPDLTYEQGVSIAFKSLTLLNQPYAFGEIPWLAYQSWRGFWNPRPTMLAPKYPMICSGLYAAAYSWATGKTLDNRECGEVTPAFLSCTQKLNDLAVNWLRIVPSSHYDVPAPLPAKSSG